MNKHFFNLLSALTLTSLSSMDSTPRPNNYHSDIKHTRNGKANRKKTKAQRIARRINRKRGK